MREYEGSTEMTRTVPNTKVIEILTKATKFFLGFNIGRKSRLGTLCYEKFSILF